MGYRVAVVGATGNVGREMLVILEELNFPVDEIHALASRKSMGMEANYGDKVLRVQDAAQFDFSTVDIVLMSVSGAYSKEWAPKIAAAGPIVIDNSSAWRMDPDVPLIVPEVNPDDVSYANRKNIIANPNCSTVQLVVALKPLHDISRIKRVVVSTYQSVSGAGKAGMDELWDQTKGIFVLGPTAPKKFPKQIAFNVIPHIDDFQDNGYTKEEMKMVWETRKILEDESIRVNPTAVRVPVFYGHSEAVHIETRDPISAEQARELLEQAPGVVVIDERKAGGYPTPVSDAAGTDAVYVGRIRDDISHENGLNLWIVSDNIRKGAALNAVQVAELLIQDYL